MGLGGYPQDLPGLMKLLNNYKKEIGKTRNFRKTSLKDKTGIDFTQTHNNDSNGNNNTNSKGKYHLFNYKKNITSQHHSLNWNMNIMDSYMPMLDMKNKKNTKIVESQE